VSSIIEAGQLFLPNEAHWLGEFKSELLAFPSGRYNDQVDALTQLLEWVRDRIQRAPLLEGPAEIPPDGADEDYPGFEGDPWGA
jgi:hypothetical protein